MAGRTSVAITLHLVETAHNRTTSQALATVWAPAFLAALRETGIVRDACEACNIGRRTAYDLRERDAEFAAAWDDAMQDAADLLELEAVRRARIGVREPVVYQGRPQGVWVNMDGDVVAEGTPGSRLIPFTLTKYSDGLLTTLLKGARPEKFNAGTNTTNVKVSGDPKQPVKVEHDHEHSGAVGVTPASAAVLEFLRDLGLPCPEPVRADGGEEPVDTTPPVPPAATVPPPH